MKEKNIDSTQQIWLHSQSFGHIHTKLLIMWLNFTFIFSLHFLNMKEVNYVLYTKRFNNCSFFPFLFSFSFSSHHHWFPMRQQLPCLALVPLTIVFMCWSHSWSSGRASREKKNLWPPASFSAHTQPLLPLTWALSSCANMSRYQGWKTLTFELETYILFERNLVKINYFFNQGHAADVFEAYSQLLTEMVLRLPYQIKKIADTNPRIPPPVFDHSWFYFLSEVSCWI